MSTHNICFHGELRKILCGYPLLSVAMHFMQIVSSVHPDQCPIPGVWSVSLLII